MTALYRRISIVELERRYTSMEPSFIQLGPLFINVAEIIYVDFADSAGCLLVLRSLDKGPAQIGMPQRFIQSEELRFSAESPEYHALRTWLAGHTTVLVPDCQQIIDSEA